MSKICILHAPKLYIGKCPPQGLMSIAAYLKGNDVKIDILDANIHYVDYKQIEKNTYQKMLKKKRFINNNFDHVRQKYPEEELKEYLTQNQFDLIFIDCNFTGTVNHTFRTIKLIKNVLPECIIVAGGIHATLFHEQILREHPVDIIIRGEGEEIALDIAKSFVNEKLDLADIEGISYKSGDEIVVNQGSGFIKDLNALFPVYDVFEEFEIDLYRKYVKAVQGPFWGDQDPVGAILTSRGCIGRCTFCNGRTIDQGKYRSLSKENVLKYLTFIHEKYKPRKIGVYDAVFGGNTKTYKAVCDFFTKVKTPWGFETRIDIMTEEKLDYLKDTNCKYILYGLESVNVDTLKHNRKIHHNTKEDEYMDKALRLFKKTSKLKILCSISILYGLPGEDKDIFNKTVKFIKDNSFNRNRYHSFVFYVPIMYPGTDMWNEADPRDRCYEWDKFFVNTENIIEEGTIIYENPNFTKDLLNRYVQKSYNVISGRHKNLTLRESINIKKTRVGYILKEGLSGIDGWLFFKWFVRNIIYTLREDIRMK